MSQEVRDQQQHQQQVVAQLTVPSGGGRIYQQQQQLLPASAGASATAAACSSRQSKQRLAAAAAAGGSTSKSGDIRLLQQSSGDTGLGSSMEISPSATPVRAASEEHPTVQQHQSPRRVSANAGEDGSNFPGAGEHRKQQQQQQQQQQRSEAAHSKKHPDEPGTSGIGGVSLATTESAWMRWSRDRRSMQQRRQRVQQQQPAGVAEDADVDFDADFDTVDCSEHPEPPMRRISTPIMKAREESANLVTPELYNRRLQHMKHLQQQQLGLADPTAAAASGAAAASTAAATAGTQPLDDRRTRRKRRQSLQAACQELTPAQWSRLRDYWEHPTFVQLRFLAAILSLIGGGVLGYSATSIRWSHHAPDNATVAFSGLWKSCFRPNGSCATNFHLTHLEGRDWQKAIFGLVLFSVFFAFCGTVLAGLGICVTFLPKKMYYLHSAGEVCFVAALASGAGLSVYPHTVRKLGYKRHHYGNAYWLSWAACVLQTLAALCLVLDHLVRESSRPRQCPRCCCLFCRRLKRRRMQRHMSAKRVDAAASGIDEEQFELKSTEGGLQQASAAGLKVEL